MFAMRRIDKWSLLGSFKQSAKDTVLSFMRRSYVSPVEYLKRMLAINNLDDESKEAFHYSTKNDKPFEHAFGKLQADKLPDEWRNQSQLELFNLPEHPWPETVPSKTIPKYERWEKELYQ